LVLLEYELLPYFSAIFEYLLAKRGIRYIVDYDDAIFHQYDMSQNILIKLLLKKKIVHVITYASEVIVCNNYLKSYAIKYNSNITTLPTVVLLDSYKKEMERFKKEERNSFIIGWIGSRTTSVYIIELLPVMAKIIREYQNIKFHLVGFDSSLLTAEEIEKYHIVVIPWREENEIREILRFDVGIMPLHDDPWSRGKCGFKLVQYMSCKKPLIASPVGLNKSIVKNGTNGYLAKNSDEWFDAISKLYIDMDLKKEMAENNFEKVEKEFNFFINCKQYINLLDKDSK